MRITIRNGWPKEIRFVRLTSTSRRTTHRTPHLNVMLQRFLISDKWEPWTRVRDRRGDIRYHTHPTTPRHLCSGPRGMWGDVGGREGTRGDVWDVWDHRNETSVTCRLHALIPENRLPIEESLSNLTGRAVVCACRWAYERMPKELWSTHRKNCAKSELEVKHWSNILKKSCAPAGAQSHFVHFA